MSVFAACQWSLPSFLTIDLHVQAQRFLLENTLKHMSLSEAEKRISIFQANVEEREANICSHFGTVRREYFVEKVLIIQQYETNPFQLVHQVFNWTQNT